jgi:hypothetical protein
MRTKYKYLKKKNKSNIINNIYPHNQMNYDGIQVEDEPDFQDEQDYMDEEEQVNYYNKRINNPQKERVEYYDEDNLDDYSNKNKNYQRNIGKGAIYYKTSKNKALKNDDLKNKYFFNNFNKLKNNEEYDNEKANFTMNNFETKKINEKYYITNINEKGKYNNQNPDSYHIRKKTNLSTKLSETNLNNYNNNENNNNNNDEFQKEVFTPKYYRNNPLVHKGNKKMQKLHMGNREENTLKSVAQKICNYCYKRR